jgi:hypothetical protein
MSREQRTRLTAQGCTGSHHLRRENRSASRPLRAPEKATWNTGRTSCRGRAGLHVVFVRGREQEREREEGGVECRTRVVAVVMLMCASPAASGTTSARWTAKIREKDKPLHCRPGLGRGTRACSVPSTRPVAGRPNSGRLQRFARVGRCASLFASRVSLVHDVRERSSSRAHDHDVEQSALHAKKCGDRRTQ